MIAKSIRWRLPLTYAGIAVLATVCLGAALLVTLRGYYVDRERLHLQNNAQAISESVAQLQAAQRSNEEIATQLRNLSFITQSRLRVLDTNGALVVDSGSPATELSLGFMATRATEPLNTFTFEMQQSSGELVYPYMSLRASTSSPVPPEIVSEYAAASGGVSISRAEADTWVYSVDVPPPAIVHMRDENTIAIEGGGTGFARTNVIGAGFAGTAAGRGGDVRQLIADRVFMLSSTPYGFDLIGEVKAGVVSDQTVTLPLYSIDGTPTGYLELSEGMSFSTQIMENVTIALIFAGAAAILIAGLVGWWISRQISKPVMSLTEGAARMAQGDLAVRVSIPGRDELSVMAGAFNDMAAQVEATILALRRFVADAAHELHTPLTALRADLELAATDADDTRRLHYVECARAQVRRIELLTDNLLDLSRIESKSRPQPPRPVDLVQVVHDLSEAYASRAEQVNVTFSIDAPNAPVRVMGDEQQLRRAVGNLLDNAIKFTPDGGSVGIAIRQVGGGCIEIAVRDTGIGIPAADIPGLFSRFHRGRNANTYPGSGLGLAIIKAILDGHGGRIAVNSMPGDTRFTVQLPAV